MSGLKITGIAAGNNGVILKTTNGGIDWIQITSGTTDSFLSIRYVSDSNGNAVYVAGGLSAGGADVEGLILNSTDGGDSWNSIDSKSSRTLYSICFPTSSIGYAVGDGGVIIKTFDVIIPVEFTSFGSFINGNTVTLNWQTATELNNQGFEVQRLQDNKTEKLSEWIPSEQDWEKIGFVPGYRTTTETKSYSFTDENLRTGKYQYRLKQTDYNGTFKYSNTIEVEINIPAKFSLEQNYPNPFNPVTAIKFELPVSSNVEISIFSSIGEKVETLTNKYYKSGYYQLEWRTDKYSSGVYYYQLKTKDFVETKKMILLR